MTTTNHGSPVPPASAPAATAGEPPMFPWDGAVKEAVNIKAETIELRAAAPTGEEAETPERLVTEFWHAVAEWERKNQRNNKHARQELSAAYERAQAAYDAVLARLTAQATALAALRARVEAIIDADERKYGKNCIVHVSARDLRAALAPRQPTGDEHG